MKEYRLLSKIILPLYLLVFLGLLLYSFTQIDLGLVISRYHFFYQIEKVFQHIGYFNRPLSTSLYLLILLSLGSLYIFMLHIAAKKEIEKKIIWKIIFTGAILLTLSYNAFSYDLFNYIFDARIFTHYHANPYLHKALDYPGDPMLGFMHWTHRVYPYGPFWLLLTIPLSFIGLQLFLPTFYLFKILITVNYLGSLFFIGKIFQKLKPEREVFALVFFGLNPLILIECLVSSHIDIVMMFFSLLAFSFLLERKYVTSYASLFFSIGIKFLTGLLLPVFVLIHILQQKKNSIPWEKATAISLLLLSLGIVTETKQSGNFQSWYLIAALSYAVFLSDKYYILIPSVIISMMSLLLYVPYLFLGNWDPPVPHILNTIIFLSYVFSLLAILSVYFYRRFSLHVPLKGKKA